MQIKLSFFGATRNVTGSQYLLEANSVRLLIDCGLYQERHLLERNWKAFAVPPNSIDAVLLTHAHLDHCGLLPKLAREGFEGRIYCTSATAEIAKIILLDSANIQEEDAEFKRKRHEREGRKGKYPEIPLYTAENAERCFPLFSPVRYGDLIPIGEDVEVSFYDAGHVLGSAMIKVRVNQDGQQRIVLFSGDVGRPNRPILRDPTPFCSVDYVVTESTYGDRLHDNCEDIDETLAEVVNNTRQAGGNLVIPSFALERSQEILYHLHQLLLEDRIPHLMVFMDSPMAISVTEVFERHPEMFDEQMLQLIRQGESPFDFPGLTMTRTTAESKAINHIKGTVIIIAGSGMCTGGRIKHHLVNNIARPESTILFVGYQAGGTLGRQILGGAEKVRILGQTYPVRARVAQISGFSGHADRDELFHWLSALQNRPRGVFVVHGELRAAQNFAEYLTARTNWSITIPDYKTELVLD